MDRRDSAVYLHELQPCSFGKYEISERTRTELNKLYMTRTWEWRIQRKIEALFEECYPLCWSATFATIEHDTGSDFLVGFYRSHADMKAKKILWVEELTI